MRFIQRMHKNVVEYTLVFYHELQKLGKFGRDKDICDNWNIILSAEPV
jgi:hypothetical protein